MLKNISEDTYGTNITVVLAVHPGFRFGHTTHTVLTHVVSSLALVLNKLCPSVLILFGCQEDLIQLIVDDIVQN